MQSWTMIPLHIRLTERYKIDPNYPDDDARWWKNQEKKGFAMSWSGGKAAGQSENQLELLQILRERGEINTNEIRQLLGWTGERTRCVVEGLSREYPIYEEAAHTFPQSNTYGLLA